MGTSQGNAVNRLQAGTQNLTPTLTILATVLHCPPWGDFEVKKNLGSNSYVLLPAV